jgi:hypothetical protein
MLNCVLRDAIVMMATDTAVLDALTLGGQLSGKLLGSLDPIVGAVGTGLNARSGSFAFKTELGLNGLSSSETDLVNDGEFGAGSVTKDGAAAELLGTEIIPSCGELSAKKWGLVLVRENQVAGFELVEFENTVGAFYESRPGAGSAFLFVKLAGSAFGRMHSGRSHLNSKRSKEATPSNPLSVLPSEMAPLGVPTEKALLE